MVSATLPGMITKPVKVTAYQKGYTGGKEAAGTYQKIINEIRPFDVLIIPFLGHCAITRNIDLKGAKVIGIDKNPDVIQSWRNEAFDFIELHTGNGWEITSQFLANKGLDQRICVYCDPTYRMESIKSHREPYPFTMNDHEHQQFLTEAMLWPSYHNVDVLISHYPDKMYDGWLKGWRNFTFQSTTRQGQVTEKLYLSYTHETGRLHDYQYVGNDKHERYNLKHRAAKNLIAKLERMEVRKRQAMLYYLKDELDRWNDV